MDMSKHKDLIDISKLNLNGAIEMENSPSKMV